MDLSVLEAFEIRCMFDYKLVKAAGSTVTPHVLTEASQFRDLFHPWCQLDGQPAGWDYRGAVPIRVSDLPANQKWITQHRAESLKYIAQSLLVVRDYGDKPAVPVQLTILTYDLGDGISRLVLDGSHRLGGLAKALSTHRHYEWPLKLLEVRIHGPVNGQVCPDIYHHTGGVPEHLLKDAELPN